jgi:hypothetical protein
MLSAARGFGKSGAEIATAARDSRAAETGDPTRPYPRPQGAATEAHVLVRRIARTLCAGILVALLVAACSPGGQSAPTQQQPSGAPAGSPTNSGGGYY